MSVYTAYVPFWVPFESWHSRYLLRKIASIQTLLFLYHLRRKTRFCFNNIFEKNAAPFFPVHSCFSELFAYNCVIVKIITAWNRPVNCVQMSELIEAIHLWSFLYSMLYIPRITTQLFWKQRLIWIWYCACFYRTSSPSSFILRRIFLKSRRTKSKCRTKMSAGNAAWAVQSCRISIWAGMTQRLS